MEPNQKGMIRKWKEHHQYDCCIKSSKKSRKGYHDLNWSYKMEFLFLPIQYHISLINLPYALIDVYEKQKQKLEKR